MAGNSWSYRYWVRVLALVLVEVAVFTALLRAAPLMGSVDLSHPGSWLSQTTPSGALTGLIRFAGMLLSAWLAGSTLVYGVAIRSSGVTARRRVARLTFSPLRRLIDSAAALSILVSATTTSASVAGIVPAASAATVATNEGSFHSTPSTGRVGTGAPAVPASTGPSMLPVSASVIGRHLPHPGLADHNDPSAPRPGSGDLQDVSSLTRSLGLAVGTRVYVVRPGDCLSVIAERHLGDWRRDQEIDALNRGRIQPDGRALVDDHWIYPGWVLVMPADAVDIETVEGVPGSALSPPVAPPAPARSATVPVRQPGTVTVESSARPAPEPQAHPTHGRGALTDAEVAMTALAAAAFVWGIRRRRREAMHDRPSGRAVFRSRPSVEQADARARAQAGEETIRWVDAGLRYLGRALLEREESTVPSIAMVRAAPNGMEVMVSPPDTKPPRHFEAIEAGAIWVLDPNLDLAELEALAAPSWPFLPALVSLGEAPGGTVLVNLEHVGALSLEGDPDRVGGLLAQMALELRSHPWAEEMLGSLDLVGLPFVEGDGLADLPAVVESASRTAGRYQAELAAAPSVAIRRAAACQWLPAVALLGQGVPLEDRELLAGIARPDRSGVAVVSWGPVPGAPWQMSIGPTGEATLAGIIGGRPFEMRLRVTADGRQLSLLEQALAAPLGEEPRGADGEAAGGASEVEIDPDLVVGADQLAELEDWMAGAADRDSDDWGELTMDGMPAEEKEEVGSDSAGREWVEGAPRSVGFRSDSGPVIDLRVGIEEPAPPAGAQRVELRVLGPVELVGGAGPDSVPASRRASALAVICYLATRTRPASADQIATALWPADVSKDNFGEPRRKTVMNVISRARLLLGESTASSSRLLLTDRGYTLSDDVTCDWTRFQGLTESAVGSAAELAAGLKEALELVGGEPFAGSLSRPFYEWVSAEHLDLAIVARVVDTAERLGRLALDSGDHDTAEWAVQKGLELDPAREELFQVWMHVAGRAGRPDRVDDIYRRLCRSLQRHIDAGLSPSEASEAVRSAYCVRPTPV